MGGPASTKWGQAGSPRGAFRRPGLRPSVAAMGAPPPRRRVGQLCGRRAGHPRRVHRSGSLALLAVRCPILTDHRHGGTRCNRHGRQGASLDCRDASSSGSGGRATASRRARSTGAPRPADSSRTEPRSLVRSTRREPPALGRRGVHAVACRCRLTVPAPPVSVTFRRLGLTLLIVLALLLAIDLVTWRWGHDSHNGRAWNP